MWSIETAGPVYIKLSQWASTRRDIFPVTVCNRLAKLQRETKPHKWKETVSVLNKEWGPDWKCRIHLDQEVKGSGCCAQVYKGVIKRAGEEHEVAVKVVHPGLRKQLEVDFLVMEFGAKFITWLLPSTNWLNLNKAVSEFRNLLLDQVDMRKETANLITFRRNFLDYTSDIFFPEPIVDFCGSEVLVEDWVDGLTITEYMDREDMNSVIGRKNLASLGVDMLLKMIFVDNYWHGDLHPGNVLVTNDMKLCVIDTGVASSLSRVDRENLILTFKAVVLGNSMKVGELFLERSYHECLDKEKFIAEMGNIVSNARNAQLSLDRIDVCSLLYSVFDTLMKHKVRLDANFSSVVIAIAIVEGLGRALDPQLDLVERALPYLVK